MAALHLSSLARLVVLSLAAFSLGHASADPTDDKARALELARAGDQAYKAGEFEKAAELVRQAYALYPEPTLLYNLALALDGMGATEDALVYYERYLATDPAVKDRGAIERRVANMRQQLANKAAEREQQLAAERAAKARESSATPREPAPASKLPFVTVGAGVAVAAVGFGFGIVSAARHDDAKTAPSQIAVQALQDRAQQYATTANVLFVAGGAIVVGGAIWAVLDYRRRDNEASPSHAQLLLGPSYVGLAWAMP